jgi:hypothetical protein
MTSRGLGVAQRFTAAIQDYLNDRLQPLRDKFFGMFKGADGGLALHGGKVFQEIVQSLPALEVIQKRLG